MPASPSKTSPASNEAKQDLQEIVEFLARSRKYQRLGGRIPRGVLLVALPAPARR